MTTRFEATHPRCPWCGAWAKRYGDRIQCNSPRCAKVSTYHQPEDPIIPVIGYRVLPLRQRKHGKVRGFVPNQFQDQFNLDNLGEEEECDE